MMASSHHADDAPSLDPHLQEILGAYYAASAGGREPDRAEWLATYPELAAQLREFFADQDRLARLGAPLRPIADAARVAAGSCDSSTFWPDEEPSGDLQAPSTSDPPAGSRVRYFGDYELRRVIARGGMGVVYYARQLSLRRPVALKMILAGRLATASEVERFRAEAEAVALLDHPGIVPLFEVGEHGGRHYFTMKLYEGGSLADRLDRYTADPRAAARLVADVARAVHHAHQRGILHRDLKPSNILIDAAGQPHIADFGLAKRLGADGDQTATGLVIGSPSFMAPEQASGVRGGVTVATDVYGLGAVLYALLTGRPPFVADSVLETLEKVKTEAPQPLREPVDRDLATICLKCLEKEPARRYGSAEALADDLDRWLRGEPIAARPASRLVRFRLWARRNPRVAALSMAIALLGTSFIIALTIGMVFLDRERRKVDAQRLATEANFRLARDAVDQMLTEIGQKTLAGVPQVEPVRRALLEKALAFNERLQAQKGDDPEIRLEVARAYLRAGRIELELGDRAAAERTLTRSRDLLRALMTERPRDPVLPRDLADCEYLRAGLYMASGRTDDGLRLFRQAKELLTARTTPGRETADTQSVLGSIQSNWGGWLRELERLDEAQNVLRDGQNTATRLVTEAPDVAKYQSQLGAVLNNLAGVSLMRNELASARRLWEQAIACQEQALKRDSRNPTYREFARNHRENLALVLAGLGRRDEAIAAIQQALADGKVLVHDFPYTPRHKADLAGTHLNLAQSLRYARRLADAGDEYRQGEAIMRALVGEYPDHSGYRRDWARFCRAEADWMRDDNRLAEAAQAWGQAVTALEPLAAKEPRNAEYRRSLFECRMSLARLLASRPNAPFHDPLRAISVAEAVNQALERPRADALYLLGLAHYRAGHWDSAIQAADRAIKLTGDPTPAQLLALAHWQRGNHEEARKWRAEATGRLPWFRAQKKYGAAAHAALAQTEVELESLMGPAPSMPNGVDAFARSMATNVPGLHVQRRK
jgi:serine/threonine-protein kinase